MACELLGSCVVPLAGPPLGVVDAELELPRAFTSWADVLAELSRISGQLKGATVLASQDVVPIRTIKTALNSCFILCAERSCLA
jgi:hypothetical protein